LKLVVQRNKQPHQGFNVSVESDGKRDVYCLINGNMSTHRGVVVLLSLDQDSVYGLSHPSVVSRILSKGPQVLLSTKDTAHKLFEHGMKASLGRIKVGENQFLTSLETFYALRPDFKALRLEVLAQYSSPVLQVKGEKSSVYITTRKILELEAECESRPESYVELERISGEVVIDLNGT